MRKTNNYAKEKYTDEELILLLIEWSEKHNKIPSTTDIKNDKQMPDPNTYSNRFGRWYDALIQCGFNIEDRVGQRNVYTKEYLLEKLDNWIIQNGRIPRIEDITNDKDMPSRKAYMRCFGNLNTAIKQCGYEPVCNIRHSEKELLNFLNNWITEHNRYPLKVDIDNDKNMPSAKTYIRRFGSIEKAVQNCGVILHKKQQEETETKKKQLLKRLKTWETLHNKVPKAEDINIDASMPSVSTYVRYFGSLEKAIEMCGIYKNEITKDELINKLLNWSEKNGRIPTKEEIRRDKDMPSVYYYVKCFGSWKNALKSCGINGLSSQGRYTKEILIEMLQKWGKINNKVPTRMDIEIDFDMPSSDTYIRRFGTWNNALVASGFKIRHQFSKQELISMLMAWVEKNGKIPTGKEIDNDRNMPCCGTYIQVFGSWRNAIKECGYEVPGLYTKEQLLNLLKVWIEENKKIPSSEELNNDKTMPSATTYIKFFGSWRNALNECGYEPRKKGDNNNFF